MNTFSEKLRQVIKNKELTAKEFASRINVTNQTLNNYLNDGRLPKAEVLQRIKQTFNDVSIDWLLSEELTMVNEPEESYGKKNDIPLIPISAMAGFGNGDVTVMDYEVSKYSVPEFKTLKAEFMIKVKGDSMAERYKHGDLVACKKVSVGGFFQWNEVYVLDTSQGALLKRVTKSDKKDHILCISNNKDYAPFDLPLSELYSLAIVLGAISF